MLPEYKNVVRTRIMEAALRVFSERGYHDSRMDDIATEAGLSKPTLYEYVQSKEAILKAISESSKESMIQSLSFEGLDPMEILRRNYENLVKFRGVLHLGFEVTSLSSHDESIKLLNREVYKAKGEALTAFLRRQQADGEIRKEIDAELAAQLLTAVYSDVATQLIIGCEESEIHEYWSTSMTAILGDNRKPSAAHETRRHTATQKRVS